MDAAHIRCCCPFRGRGTNTDEVCCPPSRDDLRGLARDPGIDPNVDRRADAPVRGPSPPWLDQVPIACVTADLHKRKTPGVVRWWDAAPARGESAAGRAATARFLRNV